jgi:hypothetical protein
MKKQTHILAILCVATFLSGCATPYMVDRGRDAADIFTATVGSGAEIKARFGPMQVALGGTHADRGLRGGVVADFARGLHGDEHFAVSDGAFLVWGAETFDPLAVPRVHERDKNYGAFGLLCFAFLPNAGPQENDIIPARLHYYSQIEVVIGVVKTLRLGFNPGELLDFILGWTTIDIFGDDIESRHSSSRN